MGKRPEFRPVPLPPLERRELLAQEQPFVFAHHVAVTLARLGKTQVQVGAEPVQGRVVDFDEAFLDPKLFGNVCDRRQVPDVLPGNHGERVDDRAIHAQATLRLLDGPNPFDGLAEGALLPAHHVMPRLAPVEPDPQGHDAEIDNSLGHPRIEHCGIGAQYAEHASCGMLKNRPYIVAKKQLAARQDGQRPFAGHVLDDPRHLRGGQFFPGRVDVVQPLASEVLGDETHSATQIAAVG